MLDTAQAQILRDEFANMNIPEADMDALIAGSQSWKYQNGDILQHDIDISYSYFLVTAGSVRAFSLFGDRKEVTMFYIDKGIDGFFCPLTIGDASSAYIALQAIGTTHIIVIPSAVLTPIRQRNPELNERIVNLLINRFASTIDHLSTALFMPLGERLWEFLVQHESGGIVRATHAVIANELGCAREAVSRLLKDMEKSGKITLSRGKIVLNFLK